MDSAGERLKPDATIAAVTDPTERRPIKPLLFALLLSGLAACGPTRPSLAPVSCTELADSARLEALARDTRPLPGRRRGGFTVRLCHADALYELGRFAEAAPAYASALKAGRTDWQQARALLGQAASLSYLGDHDQAIALLERKLLLDQRSGDGAALSKTYATLASVYSQKQQPETALRLSLAAAGGLSEPQDLGATYNNIALLYAKLDDYPRAHDYFDRAITIDQAHGLDKSLGIHRINKASLHQRQHQHDLALPLLESGIALARETSDDYWELQGRIALGESLFAQGQTAAANAALTQAARLADRLQSDEDRQYIAQLLAQWQAADPDRGP